MSICIPTREKPRCNKMYEAELLMACPYAYLQELLMACPYAYLHNHSYEAELLMACPYAYLHNHSYEAELLMACPYAYLHNHSYRRMYPHLQQYGFSLTPPSSPLHTYFSKYLNCHIIIATKCSVTVVIKMIKEALIAHGRWSKPL